MDRLNIGIVIPAFNEEKTIVSVINEVIPFGIPIVVNDGSTDRTAPKALNAGATIVNHQINTGYDAALNSGFLKAIELNCQIIITFDADGQHKSTLIKSFLKEINNGADVVIGIRNKRARITEIIFSWVAKALWKIEDPLCGMKAYRSLVYKDLGHFDSYKSIGSELSIFAAKNKYWISQIPVSISDRIDKPRLGSIFSSNYKIFRAIIISVLKYQ